MGEQPYEAIVVGSSAGGLRALLELLLHIPAAYPLPIMIVQHLLDGSDNYLAQYLNDKTAITVKEADDKEPIEQGYAYLAPPGYHLLIEDDPWIHTLISLDLRSMFYLKVLHLYMNRDVLALCLRVQTEMEV
jgi:chemotaxis response regulator CheB